MAALFDGDAAAVIISNVMWRFLPLDSLSEQDRKFEKILCSPRAAGARGVFSFYCHIIIIISHHPKKFGTRFFDVGCSQ